MRANNVQDTHACGVATGAAPTAANQSATATPHAAASATPSERPIHPITRARIALVRALLMAWVRAFSLKGLYGLGRFFGTCEYLCDYNRRRRVRRKLHQFFKDELSPARVRLITWRYFMRIRCDKMFYTIMDRIPRDKLFKRIKLKGIDQIDEALQRGRGVYVALCHFGSHHIAGLMMALLGYDIAGVRDDKESVVRRYIAQKYRETFPEVARMKMFYSSSFPRQIMRHMQQNGIVASLLDVDRRRGETTRMHPVNIFGEEREFLAGPVQMAIRCGATTFQGFVVSRRNFYYQLIIDEKLIDPDQPEAEDVIVQRVMQHYANNVEAFARRHPDHLMKI